MNSRRALIFLSILCLAWARDVLTNDSVLKLVKAGMPESIVLTMVNQQPGKYL